MGGGERREGRGGGEYEYSVALQRRVRSDSTHLGRKPGAQGWLEALGSGIFFNFSSSPMILFPLPEFSWRLSLSYMADYRGTPLTLYWLCCAVAGSIPS